MKKKKLSDTKRQEYRAGYLFITPYYIGFFAFILIPLVYSIYLAFTDYSGLATPQWIGFGNFIKMFTTDKVIWKSFWVTWKYAIVQVPLTLIVALLVAVLLSKKTKLTGTYRLIFYIPSLLAGSVAMAVTWKQIFAMDGAVNDILSFFNIPAVKWLHDPKIALYVLVFMSIWGFGGQMLIFLAGLKNIPSSLVEAAVMDGASPVKVFFSIKLPILSPIIFYNLIQGVIGSLQAFSGAYLITDGGPMNSTLYYGLYQYQMGFTRNYMGYASAMAWFMVLVILALTALIFKSSAGWVYFQDEG